MRASNLGLAVLAPLAHTVGMTIDDDRDLDGLKKVGQVVARCLRMMLEVARPGMTTLELDELGAKFLDKHGARSAPRLTYDFPGATCVSINEEIAHGIPGDRVIAPGDVLNVDVSAELDGYFADTGGTVVVPPSTERLAQLLASTQRALSRSIEVAKAGGRISEVGRVIEAQAVRSGFGVIRNLGSHGVGRALHEPPEIPGHYEPRDTRRFQLGAVITIEPFLTTGPALAEEGDDGWTLLNMPGGRSAQFEHTMVITKKRPVIVTHP